MSLGTEKVSVIWSRSVTVHNSGIMHVIQIGMDYSAGAYYSGVSIRCKMSDSTVAVDSSLPFNPH